ncbi:hypothetical protein BDZ91DRAFT_784807 [Kalaharituber pfeilii]|nr:hypothetical protein BDZ91DRAFT_784807 [Kalaharituber pfeilii]
MKNNSILSALLLFLLCTLTVFAAPDPNPRLHPSQASLPWSRPERFSKAVHMHAARMGPQAVIHFPSQQLQRRPKTEPVSTSFSNGNPARQTIGTAHKSMDAVNLARYTPAVILVAARPDIIVAVPMAFAIGPGCVRIFHWKA